MHCGAHVEHKMQIGGTRLVFDRNLIQLRKALAEAETDLAITTGISGDSVRRVLRRTQRFYQQRGRGGAPLSAPDALMCAIDSALRAQHPATHARGQRITLALTGLRCNLFPAAPAYQPHSS